jgi:hypothetical protein
LLVLGVLLMGGPPAHGHLIPGSVTLQQLTRAADVVAIAKIADPGVILEFKDPPLRRKVVDAELVEVLRGEAKRGPVRFVPHAHGGAEYARGEEVLVFLQNIDRNREYSKTPLAGAVRYAGIDDLGDHITLSATSRDAFIAAVREYTAAFLLNGTEQPHALGRITLKLLGSNEPRLATFALRDLAFAGGAPLVTEADLPELDRLIGDASRSIGVRVALLIELDRRKLVDAVPRWVRLLRETRAAELPDVARGAGKNAHPDILRELVRWMEGGDRSAAAAAAEALGSRNHHAAVEPLTRALASNDGPLRRAALRSLGKIASPEARLALKRAAESHPDADMRRLARTELNLLGEPPPIATPVVEPQAAAPSLLRTYWKAWALLAVAVAITAAVSLRQWRKRRLDQG